MLEYIKMSCLVLVLLQAGFLLIAISLREKDQLLKAQLWGFLFFLGILILGAETSVPVEQWMLYLAGLGLLLKSCFELRKLTRAL